ncbi:MAG: cytochrome c family protein [Rhizobiales bacterium]|nr:cytochrome c family protein [Hyphomicrobiales bacterium]
MDSFEVNKIIGAVLGTALMVFGLKGAAEVIYHSEKPKQPGFVIEVADAATGGEATGGGEVAAVSLGTLLAAADPKKGEAAAKACITCHTFNKGGAKKTGPNLWDIVDRPHGSVPDFPYSDAMKAKASEPWTYDALNTFIKNPKEGVPGTKMIYPGLKKDTARADLLAYLASLSDAPKPFPAP